MNDFRLSSPLPKGQFAPGARRLLQRVFDHFDADEDGAWNVSEWEAVQQSLGDTEQLDQTTLNTLAESFGVG